MLRLTLLLSVITATGCATPTEQDSWDPWWESDAEMWRTLAGWREVDIVQLLDSGDMNPRDRARLRRALPPTQGFSQNWYLWGFPNAEPPWLLVCQASHLCSIPGSAWVTLYRYDLEGKPIDPEASFHTYNRTDLRDVRLNYSASLNGAYLVVESGHYFSTFTTPVRRDFCGLVDRRILPIRSETSEGDIVRAHYGSGSVVGPMVPWRSVDQILTHLESDSPIEQLAALHLLSGYHRRAYGAFDAVEVPPSGELVFLAAGDARVITRLEALTESDLRWVREAATLALDPRVVGSTHPEQSPERR